MSAEQVSVDDLQIGNNSNSDKLLEVKRTIQKYKEYEEEVWSEEKINKLKNFVDMTKKDFQYIGYYLDASPGSCYRQFCSFFRQKGSWNLYEDIQLLSFLKEGISDPRIITEISLNRTWKGIEGRIDRLITYNLHTFDLYFEPFNIPCEEVFDLAAKIESLNIETSNIETFKNETNTDDAKNINNSIKQKPDDTNDDGDENNAVKNKEIVDNEKENKSLEREEKSTDHKKEKPINHNEKSIEIKKEKLIEIKKKEDKSVNLKEKNDKLAEKEKENKVAKKCTFTYYQNHVKRMIKRDLQIYKDYYENNEDRKNSNIKDGDNDDDDRPTFSNISIQVLNALRKCDGHCPYCHREVEYLEYQQIYTGMCPRAASFDHIIPGMTTFNGNTKLQVTCQQCNFGKSNATDMEYRYYLQSIKEFHNIKNSGARKKVSVLHKTHELQAWRELSKQRSFTGVNTKAVKKRINSLNTDKKDIISDLIDQINTIDLDDNTKKNLKPEEKEKEDDDIPKMLNNEENQFLELVRKIGYRDPTTGALGVWDSTWALSRRFTLINWNYSSYKIVTDVNIPYNGIFGKEIVLKFTKDVRQNYTADEFYSWLSTIKNHEDDFI